MVHKRDAKDWGREHVKGIWTSPMMPFTPDLQLDEDGIRKNVERIVAVGAKGIGFGFSEPWSCTIQERKRSFEVSVDAVRGRIPAYVHGMDHSVAETINLIKHAEEVGADAVMFWAPYEWAKSQEMIAEYYEYVCSKVDIAIFMVNSYHSGAGLTLETIKRIAKIPNVCALKNAINDIENSIRCMEAVGNEIVVSDAVEDNMLRMTVDHGQQVLLGSTSGFLLQSPQYQPVRDYQALALQGRTAEAAAKCQELTSLRRIWNDIYVGLWDKAVASHPLPYIKFWMDVIGMAGGPMRPPLHDLSERQKAEFKARLDASGWLDRLYPADGKKAAA